MTQPRDELTVKSSLVERICTVLLMVGLGFTALIASFLGLFFSMVSDGCMGDADCSSGRIGLGVAIASLSPIVVFVVALVLVVKRFRRGLPAWWVPLAGLAIGVVLFLLGGAVAGSGVG